MNQNIEELTEKNGINYAKHGFKNYWNQNVRTCDLNVVISITRFGYHTRFGVYVNHGAYGGAFWRDSEPLVDCKTMEEAKKVAERLYGITGSGDLANIVTCEY